MLNRLNPVLLTWTSQFIQFGSAIFILPLLIKVLSTEQIAIWFVFQLVMGLGMLADAGFGSTWVRVNAYYYAGAQKIPENINDFKKLDQTDSNNPNWQGLRTALATSHLIYLGLASLGVLILLGPGTLMVKNVIFLDGNHVSDWYAYLAVVVSSFFGLLSVRWSSTLQGLGMLARTKQIDIFIGLFRLSAYVVILLSGYGLLSLMLVTTFLSIIQFFVLRHLTLAWFKHKSPDLSGKPTFNRDLFKTVWPATWRFGSIVLGSYFINNGIGVLVSQINNAALVASFLFTMRVLMFGRQVAQSPLYARLPDIMHLMAKKDICGVKSLFSRALALELSILSLLLLVIGLAGNQILAMIGLKPLVLTLDFYIPLAIWLLLEAHHAAHAQVYMTSNHVPFLLPSLLSGLVIMMLGYIILPGYGLLGLVFVQLLVQISFNNWYPVFLLLKLLEWPFKDYIKSLFNFKKLRTN